MLAELHDYSNQVSLIMNSGIQFLDFAVKIDWKSPEWRTKNSGCFGSSGENAPLRRLIESKDGSGYCDPAMPSRLVSIQLECSVEESLTLFDGIWLPIPVLRCLAGKFDNGPYNWARARIIKLEEPDSDGNTHRITIAFDTKIMHLQVNVIYFAPNNEDVSAGATFVLAHQSNDIMQFLDFEWVKEWQKEVYIDFAESRLKVNEDDIQAELDKNIAQAHYLNFLSILAEEIKFPTIVIESNQPLDRVEPIPVDMVLDVGNSRTCGILIEDHGQDSNGLDKRYELAIRDLSHPERVYTDPFESRVEFSQANFGKDNWSSKSGRREAFQWLTIARVGKEASYLAGRREGNEGSTGLSSPKRYLWDQEKYEQGWRFNSTFVKIEKEPYATAEPISRLINDLGEPLHALNDDNDEEFDRKSPVFTPKYSRSSLMMFMLTEVLAHALTQINSPLQRGKLAHSRSPRFLRSIILTVPPAMPKPERDIFKNAMYHAVGVLWKAIGWDQTEDNPDFASEQSRRHNCWPPLPEVVVQWDEATCGQVVYLFTETQYNFGGRPEEFFETVARPDKADKKKITIATVDIGGGTTDIVVNDYALNYGQNASGQVTAFGGSNVFIEPTQRFRDGFKIAGDDILLDIIREQIVPALRKALKKAGIVEADEMLSTLIGDSVLKVQDILLRQQLTLQVFVPLGLRILKAFEGFDPYDSSGDKSSLSGSIGELLSSALAEKPTAKVLDYFNTPVRKSVLNSDPNAQPFDLMDVPIEVDFLRLHLRFLKGEFDICKALNLACEVISTYQCDVLLITGRPTRLPSIQSYFKSRLPVPPGRILPLHNYKTGSWYPFHKQGYIDDPKTTASVGAMISLLSKSSKISNFYLRVEAIKAYSTIRYLGFIDQANQLKDANIYYADIDLDNPDYDFPDQEFSVRGQLRLGFRQLKTERWSASPLYTIVITNPELVKKIGQQGIDLKVSLGIDKSKKPSNSNETNEYFKITAARRSDGRSIDKYNDIKLKLNTMVDSGFGQVSYWLDSGSIKR